MFQGLLNEVAIIELSKDEVITHASATKSSSHDISEPQLVEKLAQFKVDKLFPCFFSSMFFSLKKDMNILYKFTQQ